MSEAGCQPDSSTSRLDAPKRGRPLSVADEKSSPKVQQQRVRKIESFIPAWAAESSCTTSFLMSSIAERLEADEKPEEPHQRLLSPIQCAVLFPTLYLIIRLQIERTAKALG